MEGDLDQEFPTLLHCAVLNQYDIWFYYVKIMHSVFFLYKEFLPYEAFVTEQTSLGRIWAVLLMSAHVVNLGCDQFCDAERSIIGTFLIH